MHIFKTTMLILSLIISLTLFTKVYGKNLISHASKKSTSIPNDEYLYNNHTNIIEMEENVFNNDTTVNYYDNTFNTYIQSNSKNDTKDIDANNFYNIKILQRNKRKVYDFLKNQYNKFFKDENIDFEYYEPYLQENCAIISENTVNNTYSIIKDCKNRMICKELSKKIIFRPKIDPEQLCTEFEEILPLGKQPYIYETGFFTEFFAGDEFYKNYNMITKILNTFIKNKYKNEYKLENYLNACRQKVYCLKKALQYSATLEDFIKSYSFPNFKDILQSYIIDNQSMFIDDWFTIFFEAFKPNSNKIFADIEEYVFINQTNHKQYVIQQKEISCKDFANQTKFIFPLFDENNILFKAYIRSFIINYQSIRTVQHFEIYNYYTGTRHFGIYNFVKPVKKCIYHLCLVFYPSKIYYGVEGCNRIDYHLYNGEKMDGIPSVKFLGDYNTVMRHYNKNLQIAVTRGVNESELFDKEFKNTSVFKYLVNITGFNLIKMDPNCLVHGHLDIRSVLKGNIEGKSEFKMYHVFDVKKRCRESNLLDTEKYYHYFLNGDKL